MSRYLVLAVPSASAFFFRAAGDHRDLHSFPTRRSSDLLDGNAEILGLLRRQLVELHAELAEVESRDLLVELLRQDRKSTRLNSSHPSISYAVFCLKKKKADEQLLRQALVNFVLNAVHAL